jgi:hypothetical protein
MLAATFTANSDQIMTWYATTNLRFFATHPAKPKAETSAIALAKTAMTQMMISCSRVCVTFLVTVVGASAAEV